jgi:ADP-heptose:LPS heptosyltransferase
MLAEKQKNLQQVLVIQVGTRQDLISTIPALQKLRQLLANSILTLMVSTSARELGLRMPWADDVLVYEGADNFKNAECELALIAKLRQFAFDASVIFTNPQQSPYPLAYICYLAGIPIRISQSQEFGGSVFSHGVKLSPVILHREGSNTASDWMQLKDYDSIAQEHHLFLVESAFKEH